MAGSVGNIFILKGEEAEDLKSRGQWDSYLLCVSTMAELLPSGGRLQVEIAHNDRYMTREVVTV